MRKKIRRYMDRHCPISLANKTYIITGANSGIGFELTRELLCLHADIIMACRSQKRAENARKQLLEEFPDAKIDILILDLSSFDSIRNFVSEITGQKIKVHGFVHNAGIFRRPHEKTADGFELVMGTNYLGTYLLTTLLLPYFFSLEEEVKMVFMTSLSYRFGKIDYDDFFFEKNYHSMKVYATSKLCVNQFFVHLKKQCEKTSVRVFLTHPGVTYTPLIQKGYGKIFAKIAAAFMKLLFHKADQGSLGALYILTHSLPNGYMNGPRGIFHIRGYPAMERLSKKAGKDVDQLLALTEQLTGIILDYKATNR